MSRPSSRQRMYKNDGRTADSGRRVREEEVVRLRKEKKEEQLLKRRPNLATLSTAEDELGAIAANASPMTLQANNRFQGKDRASLEREVIEGIQSKDPEKKLEAVVQLRKALSIEPLPPIGHVIRAGLVPELIGMIRSSDSSHQLVFEATWAITNIASGNTEQTRALVQAGIVPAIIELISRTAHMDIKEQGVWAIGNIAGDCTQFRDLLLAHKVIDPLLKLMLPENKPSLPLLRNIVWTISNLNRSKNPPPDYRLMRPIIAPLSRLLRTSEDAEVLTDSCWALSYMSDTTNDRIQDIIDAGVCTRLVQLLDHKEVKVVAGAIRAIGNIVTGDDAQTQVVINSGVLAALRKLLSNGRDQICKEAAWTLSNILAGNRDQIQAVLDSQCFKPLIGLVEKGEFRTKREAIWAITNATSGANDEQMIELFDLDVLQPLTKMLDLDDSKLLQVAMTGIENMLRFGLRIKPNHNNVDVIANRFEELGGLDKLEHLQTHPNQDVYVKALGLVEKYFSDDEEPQPAPVLDTNGFFKFGQENSNSSYTF